MRTYHSIRWQLPLSYAVIAFLAVAALGVVLLSVLKSHYQLQEQEYLRRNAHNVERLITSDWELNLPMDNQIRWLSFLPQTRIQLSDWRGEIIADSGSSDDFTLSVAGPYSVYGGDAYNEDNYILNFSVMPVDAKIMLPQQEERVVIYGGTYGFELTDSTVRLGLQNQRSNQSVTIPVYSSDNSRFLGNITISGGPAIGQDVLQSVTKGWILAGSIAIILAAGIGWIISHRLTTPLIALTHSTQLMTSGDLSTRNTIHRNDELGILARSFNRMAEQIENNFTTLKRFVADAAHEIHTPITALRTNLELSVEQSPTSQNKQALNQVKQLEHLTNDLLDLSQIEGSIKADFKPLDMNSLVVQISEIYASRAEQADLDFQLELPGQPVCIEANPTQIERVISNLLDNAIKFTPQGGKIHVELEPNAKHVYLSVRDTGIGIPPDDQPLLFERFKRGRNVSTYAGSGLGLAIVKAIIDSHSGSVQAESNANGTCIKIALPIKT